MSWKPPIVDVGDIVTCSSNPEWGQGTILSVTFLGDLPLPDGEVITYQKNTVGQRASVRFADGRTRTILTPLNPLKRVQGKSVNDELKEFADIVHLLIELECASCHKVFAEPKGDTEVAIWEWAKEVSTEAYKEGWRSITKGFLCKNCLMATQKE